MDKEDNKNTWDKKAWKDWYKENNQKKSQTSSNVGSEKEKSSESVQNSNFRKWTNPNFENEKKLPSEVITKVFQIK